MGFLDHSTNNIIIDAVLTNYGRESLATNAAAFRIEKFSLADDEVDYTLIKKFGRTVGKEKIIKNTPIFEAQTGGDIAMKFRLQSITDASVTHLPVLQITATQNSDTIAVPAPVKDNTSDVVLTFTMGQGKLHTTVTLAQSMLGGGNIPAGLVDHFFDVYVNNTFIALGATGTPGTYNALDPLTNMARYATSAASAGNLSFNVHAITLLPEQFAQYSDPNDTNVITSVMSIVGRNSGARADCTIRVLNNVS